MSPRIKKDFRNLTIEALLAGMLVTIPFFLLRSLGWTLSEIAPIQMGLLAVATSWLGASIIGKELALGLLSFSLAHVESRQLLWREKMRTAASLLGVLFLLSITALILLSPHNTHSALSFSLNPEHPVMLVMIALVISIAGLGGGAFYALTLRSYQGAFWMTLLTPLAIAVVTLFPYLISPVGDITHLYTGTACTAILVYGSTLYFLARKQFYAWQDLGPWGGEIWISTGSAKNPKTTAPMRRYRPLMALSAKETNLQHLNLLVAGVLLLLYIAGISFYDAATQRPNEAALLAYFARALLLFFLPLAIGATAIAEERRLKVNQWQKVLPYSMRTQWVIKLVTVYTVTTLATVIAPLIVDLWFQEFWAAIAIDPRVQVMLAVLLPLLASTIGLYASSLSQSFLISLGSSALVIIFLSLVWLTGLPRILALVDAETTVIPQLLLAVVMVALFVPGLWCLCYANYQSDRSFRSLIATNTIAWIGLALLTVAIAQGIYQRSWEIVTHRPPPPKPSVLESDVEARILPNTWLTVLAPNGTLWTSEINPVGGATNASESALMTQIGQDADWVRAYATFQNLYGIKRDGRLFKATRFGADAYQLQPVNNPNSPTGWKQLLKTPGVRTMTALQADGSLWTWKEEKDGATSTPIPYIAEHTWKSVTRDMNGFVGIKPDGTLWAWGSSYSNHEWIRNPITDQINRELQLLFSGIDKGGPPDPEVLDLMSRHRELLKRLEIPTPYDPRDAIVRSEYRSRFRRARVNELKPYTTPYQIGTRSDWENVAFTDRLPGHGRGARTLLERVLVVTRTDGSVWVPTLCARDHWNIDTKNTTAPIYEIPRESIPKEIVSYQTNQDLGLAQLNHDGSITRANLVRDGRHLVINLSERSTELSDRSNWLTFTRSFFTTAAISDDGLLWHAGPHPIRGNPARILPLIIPPSRNLHPVFDFTTGKTL